MASWVKRLSKVLGSRGTMLALNAYPPYAAAGIRIHSGGGLGGNNFADAGLEPTGDTWESAGYAAAAVQIELDAEANLGSITLNPDDGCDET